MSRTTRREMEGSWVDVAESSSEAEEDLSAVQPSLRESSISIKSRSKRGAPPPYSPGLRNSRRVNNRVSNSYSSGLIMPQLEREVPTPKARRRRAESNVAESQRTTKRRSKAQESPFSDGAMHVLLRTLAWFFEILLGALQVIKTPLTYALGLYLLFGLFVIASNAFTSRLSAALTPICRLPGTGLLFPNLCSSGLSLDYAAEQAAEPEFDHLMQIQQKFEDLLEQSVDYYAIPAFMKHSQSAMRDVREVVRYSPLKSKNELLLEFDTFVNAASQASWDLETFNSHIGRTVDRIMLTARWTQRTLDEISGPEEAKGLIGKAVDALMSPFQPVKYTEETVLDLYIKHSDEVQSEISDLLTEAQAVFSLLKSLEDTIDSIHGITARDTYYATLGRDEVLAELWSRLGGNRKQKQMFESQLRVLKQVSTYGQTAYTSIGGAILKLQTMSAEIDQLKERLTSIDPVPGKTKVPLSVHLENIRLGVERLEEARGLARDARLGKSRGVIEKGREVFGDGVHSLEDGRKELPAGGV